MNRESGDLKAPPTPEPATAHALRVLELPRVLEAVARRAGGDLAREEIIHRTPRTDPVRVREELARVSEAMDLLAALPAWGPPVPPDARGALRRMETVGSVLDPEELLVLQHLLLASDELHRVLSDPPAPLDRLGLVRDRLVRRPEMVRQLEKTVDASGAILDSASPDLVRIRRRLDGARSRVVRQLEEVLRGLSDRVRVPDASVTIRSGRYVIPVRREGRSEVGGVIHGESGTGATLFVEPPVALRMTNEILELEREERIEIRRILREWTERLRPDGVAISGSLEALVDFDSLWARARTARDWEAEIPEVVGGAGEDDLRIRDGRHPLLLEQLLGGEGELDAVVPFFLELSPDERAMVVSGPNTGGKTVLLKAIGLLPTLAQCGVVPPVGPGTRLPVFRRVLADIGDEQSIEQSLSTFAAHLANAREILEGASPGTLVLMDEMGTGTDPSEGAALARAILEVLVERGARTVVTSHLGALKRLDEEGSGIVNASLRFDPDRIEPTYELLKGRPGRSYGLAIARRLGIPEPVLARAEALVDEGELEMEGLLESLEARERDLRRALGDARMARDEAERLRQEAREREEELSRRERGSEAEARTEARRILLEAREEVEEAIRQVRGSAGGASEGVADEVARAARRRVEEAARTQAERAREVRSTRPDGTGEDARARGGLVEGARVKLRSGGSRGRVTAVEGNRISVEVGGLRLQLSASDVEVVSDPGSGDGSSGRRVSSGGGASRTQWSEVETGLEADLRGLRVDELDLALGRALDGAVVSGRDELRIIHGKGTGALRARVRELLDQDPRVSEARSGRPGEGGAGVTVVRFR
ncbi:MAG: hypothetical protein EA352_08120 [Gemmatimonadales bacterium]|nr:MAG: hypothetical protein EA352_08120 [Gemmatimonadales bacterium]